MKNRVVAFILMLVLMLSVVPTTVFAEEGSLSLESREGNAYLVNQDGTPAKEGWHEIDGYWYYVEAEGRAATGWRRIGGKWYYFYTGDDNSLDRVGKMATGFRQIGNKYYAFKDSGAMYENAWIEHKNIGYAGNPVWSYAGRSGALLYNQWKQINGKWYYFTDFGHFFGGVSGLINDGFYEEGKSSGPPVAVTKEVVIGTELHGFDSSGAWTGRITDEGWRYENASRWRYVDADGKAAVGWKKINGRWYYFHDANSYVRGYMRSGVITVNGVKWFLNDSGALREKAGWVKKDIYYFGEYERTIWFYLNSNGSCKTGWVKDGRKWYYMDPDSAEMETGERWISSKRYIFGESGAMRTGWIKDDSYGVTYWYYGGPDGALYTDGTYVIGDESYTFDRDGRMIEE